jgi:hypothetical protein
MGEFELKRSNDIAAARDRFIEALLMDHQYAEPKNMAAPSHQLHATSPRVAGPAWTVSRTKQ